MDKTWSLRSAIIGLLVCVHCILRASAWCYDGTRNVTFTQYWIPKEGSDDVDDNGHIIHLTGLKTQALRDIHGQALAMVDKNTEMKCLLEGTCLVDGPLLLNVADKDNVFTVVDRARFPFGVGENDAPLQPYVSVASNDLQQQSKLFVNALHNLLLPNGQVHNGCVRVDDKLSEHTYCHIDFMLPFFQDYSKIVDVLPDSTEVFPQSNCELLNYIAN